MPLRRRKHKSHGAEQSNNLGRDPHLDHLYRKSRDAFPTLQSNMSSYHTNSSFNKSNSKSHRRHHKSEDFNDLEPKKHHRKIFRFKRIFLSLVLLGLIVGGYFGFTFAMNMHKLFGGNILDVFRTATLKGASEGRVNILLTGNSNDDPGHQGSLLTDSIMIISIDTKNNTSYLLSIPRDLYVNIPGYGWNKINAAYEYGQNDGFNENGLPKGGMGLLEKVIQSDFNVRLDYYALINYAAIKDAVNAVGGIDVNIQSGDSRGLYDPSIDYTTGGPLVNLSNGMHTLNGQQALDLARARGDADGSYGYALSDFTRTANQRLMLVALESKIMSAGTLSNPFRLANLFTSLVKNVNTDIDLPTAHAFYNLSKKVNINDAKSLSFQNANGVNLLKNYYTTDGQQALSPKAGLGNYSEMVDYINSINSAN